MYAGKTNRFRLFLLILLTEVFYLLYNLSKKENANKKEILYGQCQYSKTC